MAWMKCLRLPVVSALLIVAPARAQSPEFLVGFAQEDVSTERTVTLGGYGTFFGLPSSTRKNGQGIHDRLHAAAVAISGSNGATALIVGVDAVGMTDASFQRIRSALDRDMPADARWSLVVAASHTHHAPDTMGIWGALPLFTGRDARYMALIEGRTAQAALRAFASRRPAVLSIGEGSLATTSGDDVVSTLVARGADGELLGTLTQWSAHPTILDSKNNALSADFVGSFRHFMTREWPGGTHVFVNGTLGNSHAADVSGLHQDPFVEGVRDPDVGDGYERAARVGWNLFEQVKVAVANAREISDTEVDFRRAWFPMQVSNVTFRAAAKAGIVEKQILEGLAETSVGWVRIGDVRFATLPGEAFASETRKIREAMSVCGARNTMIFGMANDWLGYFIPESDWNRAELRQLRSVSPSPAAAAESWAAFQSLGCN